jgi:hypothetical protein
MHMEISRVERTPDFPPPTNCFLHELIPLDKNDRNFDLSLNNHFMNVIYLHMAEVINGLYS